MPKPVTTRNQKKKKDVIFPPQPPNSSPTFSITITIPKSPEPLIPMEMFKNAKVVRIRSHHDKYLVADDDNESVSQDRNGSSQRSKWTVESIPNDATHLALKSCYGLYLTASNVPFLFGVTGHKVLQTRPARLDSSVQWEPIRDGFQIKLRTRYGNFLRANGGVPPWRNSVTHDVPHRSATQDWLLWEVDVLEINLMPSPDDHRGDISRSSSFSEISESSSSLPCSPPKPDGRMIRYALADDDGKVDEIHETDTNNSFIFKGTSVAELKCRLEEETGIEDVIVCSRSQFDGKLYPLRLHLPPNNAPMSVVVIQASSTAANRFN